MPTRRSEPPVVRLSLLSQPYVNLTVRDLRQFLARIPEGWDNGILDFVSDADYLLGLDECADHLERPAEGVVGLHILHNATPCWATHYPPALDSGVGQRLET
jgi:hypothetical protein